MMSTSSCPVVELRQYTLYGGRRDTLIELFDREFVIPQERLGMRLLGQFRDLDDPDRFVWLRGLASWEERPQALGAFYTGEAWKAHREAANATMVDSDNVLLLRPARAGSGFAGAERDQRVAGIVTASIFHLGKTPAEAFAAFFAGTMRPRLESLGASVLAELVTETRPNNFPALPVREEDAVFVWLGRFNGEEAQQIFSEWLRRESGWRDAAPPGLLPALMRKPEFLRLAPTPLSALR
jgi:NIPSNAP